MPEDPPLRCSGEISPPRWSSQVLSPKVIKKSSAKWTASSLQLKRGGLSIPEASTGMCYGGRVPPAWASLLEIYVGSDVHHLCVWFLPSVSNNSLGRRKCWSTSLAPAARAGRSKMEEPAAWYQGIKACSTFSTVRGEIERRQRRWIWSLHLTVYFRLSYGPSWASEHRTPAPNLQTAATCLPWPTAIFFLISHLSGSSWSVRLCLIRLNSSLPPFHFCLCEVVISCKSPWCLSSLRLYLKSRCHVL